MKFLNERTIFLFDGIGAVLSAVFTALLLPMFSEWTGLQDKLLFNLAVFPVTYALFSLVCYRFVKTTKPWMLMTVMIGNTFYCLLSIQIVATHKTATVWGQIALIAEMIVILAVVTIESKVYRKFPRPRA